MGKESVTPMLMTIDDFPWKSEAQKKGYLAMMQDMRSHGLQIPIYVNVNLAFLIQKNHEANEWFVQVMGDQIKQLQNEISDLREDMKPRK